MSSEGTALLQVFQGLQAIKASKEEESALRKQGALAVQESEAEASRTRDKSDRLQARQSLAFLKSGVSLQGSPLLTLARTEELGESEAQAIERRGLAGGGLFRSKAKITRSTGRAQFLGSLAQASATSAEGSQVSQASRSGGGGKGSSGGGGK